MTTQTKTVLIGLGCGIAGFLLGAVIFGAKPSGEASQAAKAPPILADLEASLATPLPTPIPTPVAAEPAPPASDWRVDERTDSMTDAKIKTACATSSNQVYLDSPYGPRGAQLCIRQHPEFGRDVYLRLDGSGQILCRSYSDCSIPVRFDDGDVQRFSGTEPSDNSSETVFFTNEGRFITSAKAASRIRVQLEFYQNGSQTFDFPAKGLEW